jgi:hypothetical protein
VSNSVGVGVWVGIKLLEGLFAAGIVGSAVLVLLTGIEDVRTMFGSNGEKK